MFLIKALQYTVPILYFLIGISSIITIAIFFERFFYLRRLEKDNKVFIKNIFLLLKDKSIDKALIFCKQVDSIICATISKEILLRQNKVKNKEFIEDIISKELPNLEVRVSVLGTIASVAPLLGLLGTVLGMIDSLRAMELSMGTTEVQGLGLLKGIWTALSTTAAGLIVAIPALIGYNYLTNKVNKFLTFINKSTIELLDSVTKD